MGEMQKKKLVKDEKIISTSLAWGTVEDIRWEHPL